MIAFRTCDAYRFSIDSVRKYLNGNHAARDEDELMETTTSIANWTRISLAIFLVAGVAIISGNALADSTSVGRTSVTAQSTRVERDNGIAGQVSEDEHAALVVAGERSSSQRTTANSKATLQTAQAPNTDFWFYSADVLLFNDHDDDGYYHGIDLLFDADTYFISADVYAVVYLSYEGGPWNEYAATEIFTLYGTESDDEFNIVTELLSGYPAGSYDLLIELFDAYDDSFVAYFGPDDTSELAFLPLEDADRDVVIVPDIIVVEDHHHHGGGAVDGWLILMLGLAALLLQFGLARRVVSRSCRPGLPESSTDSESGTR